MNSISRFRSFDASLDSMPKSDRPLRRAAFLLALGATQCGAARAARNDAQGAAATSAREWIGVRPFPSPPPAPAPAPMPRDTWVLHIGDSFVDASFQQNLRPRFRAANTAYVASALTATYTTTWAYGPMLDRWLARRPAMVVVTLGANEVDIPVPEQHATAVATIARKIAASGASCVWTAPPLWKADKGIVNVIHDHSAPCLFFDSDAITGGLTPRERRPDGIHPNERGGARWSAALWSWLEDHRAPSGRPWALVPFEHRDP